MRPSISDHLKRWCEVGLISEETLTNIETYEADQLTVKKVGLRWPAILALTFGLILFGAGLLLYVAAHWGLFSPAVRFLQVLLMLFLLHGLGVWFSDRNQKLSITLHGLGTVALGAGIFMTGQIFNINEHWPTGVLLWALGASFGYWLLRDWFQGAFAAILIPSWLTSEWIEFAWANGVDKDPKGDIAVCALLIIAITYLSMRNNDQDTLLIKILGWIGGLAIIPLAVMALVDTRLAASVMPCITALIIVSLPSLCLAYIVRKRRALRNLLAIAWVFPLALLEFANWAAHAWAALGSTGLVIWGLCERREERINLGIVGFAITVLSFYFSSVMDVLGRSFSLMGLGVLFLVGGWQLERIRRKLNARIIGGVEP